LDVLALQEEKRTLPFDLRSFVVLPNDLIEETWKWATTEYLLAIVALISTMNAEFERRVSLLHTLLYVTPILILHTKEVIARNIEINFSLRIPYIQPVPFVCSSKLFACVESNLIMEENPHYVL
jgi:hypothetical protein